MLGFTGMSKGLLITTTMLGKTIVTITNIGEKGDAVGQESLTGTGKERLD